MLLPIETSGICGVPLLDFIMEVGRRIAAITRGPRSTVFLRQRRSMAMHEIKRTASWEYYEQLPVKMLLTALADVVYTSLVLIRYVHAIVLSCVFVILV
jgi:hypothetical protein